MHIVSDLREMRLLTTTVTNPIYNPILRHGLRSIHLFYASLPVIFEYRDKEGILSSDSVLSIDIPALGLQGIKEPALLNILYNASASRGQKVVTLPKGETAIACGVCKNPTWYHTRNEYHQPASAVCIKCGNAIKIVRSFHQPGHA